MNLFQLLDRHIRAARKKCMQAVELTGWRSASLFTISWAAFENGVYSFQPSYVSITAHTYIRDSFCCRPSWHLALVVLVISTGLALMVKGETQFDALGFVVVMTASMLSGLRWTITQVLLQGDGSSGHGDQHFQEVAEDFDFYHYIASNLLRNEPASVLHLMQVQPNIDCITRYVNCLDASGGEMGGPVEVMRQIMPGALFHSLPFLSYPARLSQLFHRLSTTVE